MGYAYPKTLPPPRAHASILLLLCPERWTKMFRVFPSPLRIRFSKQSGGVGTMGRNLDRFWIFLSVYWVRRGPAFCKEFGGVSTYIPHKPQQAGRIADVVGMSCAEALSHQLGGCNITTPTSCKRVLKRLQVERLLASGKSPRRCAFEVGCTERYARTIARQIKELLSKTSG